MPIIRLILLGTGVDGDSYRADLPIYTTMGVDHIAGTITVSVQNRVGPPELPMPNTDHWTVENNVPVLISLPQTMLTAWWQRLARDFPRRQPPHMPAFP